MQFRRKSKAEIAINIAPLVDVIFLLVIFFAVSTTFLETAGLKLELPESSSTAKREAEDITVFLGADGTLSFGDEQVDEEQLMERLRAALTETDRKVVVLRADTHTEHGAVVKVMDLIRDSGAEGLTVAARSAGRGLTPRPAAPWGACASLPADSRGAGSACPGARRFGPRRTVFARRCSASWPERSIGRGFSTCAAERARWASRRSAAGRPRSCSSRRIARSPKELEGTLADLAGHPRNATWSEPTPSPRSSAGRWRGVSISSWPIRPTAAGSRTGS